MTNAKLAIVAIALLTLVSAEASAHSLYALGEGSWAKRLDVDETEFESRPGYTWGLGGGLRLDITDMIGANFEAQWQTGSIQNDDMFTDRYTGPLVGAGVFFGSLAQIGVYVRAGLGTYDRRSSSDGFDLGGAIFAGAGGQVRIHLIDVVAFTARAGVTGPFADWLEVGGGLEVHFDIPGG